MATLKVYRTPTGFHDAYVAAPSKKAALAAWGSEHDLFARGVAEIVTDPALMREPLASPGTVIKRSRGTVEEQLAALPETPRKRAGEEHPPAPQRPVAKKKLPKPSRADLDAAESAFDDLQAAQRKEADTLARQIAALEAERSRLERSHRRDADRLENARDTAAAAYDRAVKRWQTD